jgi:hypothetical protein
MPKIPAFPFLRSVVLVSALLATSGCSKLGGEKSSGESSGPTAAKASTAASFAGAYMSNWGPCALSQEGASVSGTCTRGTTMTCQANGDTLQCDWKESSGSGKATLTRQSTGVLAGTWGSQSSVSNGGAWTFTPKR